MLAFAIPFSGYSEMNPGPTYPIYIGFSGGVNYSNIRNDIFSSESDPSGQFSFYFEQRLGYIRAKSRNGSVAFGIGLNNRKLNIRDSNNIEYQTILNFISIPAMYQFTFLGLDKENSISASLNFGFSLNLFVSEPTNNNIKNPYWLYVGVLIGSKIEYELTSNLSIFMDYNYEFGITDIQDVDNISRSKMHLINLGFKVPTTVF